MISKFFIDRPIFAWVLAIAIMVVGVLAIRNLPIAQYPTIAPPTVSIYAFYPGANAQTLENTVTQIIEQQLNGLDGFQYMSAASDSSGQMSITVTFVPGTDADIAQVQVQNRMQQALPRLPQEVQQQGVSVQKSGGSFALVVGIYDKSGAFTDADLSDYIVDNLLDPLSRVSGIGDIQMFGGQYAMRIWLDPFKLRSFSLTPADVAAAVRAQNAQLSAGQIGASPAVPGQRLNAIITAQSRLQTPEQFRAILLRSSKNGATVTLGDVARVELGSENYSATGKYDGHPAAGFALSLSASANALATIRAVKEKMTELSAHFPPGVEICYPLDVTPFVETSIHDVIITLSLGIFLVILVMFVFLQDWRATLIPAIAVPVVLLGTFGILALLGLTLNTLTMFGMVLAIGLLVDDAIVVVENVERVMAQEGLSPKEATLKSMHEITGALVGIALVLSAVFLPMAFFGGSTGVIYYQFSMTIVSAMILSVLVAIILTPALCATLLKPEREHTISQYPFFTTFNRIFDSGIKRYDVMLHEILPRRRRWFAGYGVILLVLGILFLRAPSGFLPDEDQGAVFSIFTLPTGSTLEQTVDVSDKVANYFVTKEAKNISGVFTVAGFSFGGAGQNQGMAFITLKTWDERPGKANGVQAIAGRAMGALSAIREARIFVLAPPPVPELANFEGFDFQLQAAPGMTHEDFLAARNQLLGLASQDKRLAQVRPNGLEDQPQLHLNIDRGRAGALGISQADINQILSAAWGGAYIDDFIDRGRVKRVYMQADAQFRMRPEDLNNWYVRTNSGAMAPFSAFSTSHWAFGPARLERFNSFSSFNIQGSPARGESTGAAMAAMEELAAKLPEGVSYSWNGLSYQEKLSSGQSLPLYALSILAIFLCLAALYESWSIPVSVLFTIPLGVVGALVAASLVGMANDVFFQVALLTTMGLAAKNAILIVEYAHAGERDGRSALEAAIHAARLRLRPILMTSVAFIAGVTPLIFAKGAGSGGQNVIGTGVIGGMISGTVLAIFFVPLFYVTVRSLDWAKLRDLRSQWQRFRPRSR